jgi:hypothetical protein
MHPHLSLFTVTNSKRPQAPELKRPKEKRNGREGNPKKKEEKNGGKKMIGRKKEESKMHVQFLTLFVEYYLRP